MSSEELNRMAHLLGISTQELQHKIEETWLEIRRNCMPEVDALINAGWRFDPVTDNSEPWQWYWRRPPRRKKGKGRLFLSTTQAFNALKREA